MSAFDRCGLVVARRSALISSCALRALAHYYRETQADAHEFCYLAGEGLIYRAGGALVRARVRVMDPPPRPLPVPATLICTAAAAARDEEPCAWWLSYDLSGAWLSWLIRSDLRSHTSELVISHAHEREAARLQRDLKEVEDRLARASCMAHVRRADVLRVVSDVYARRGDRRVCRMTVTRRAWYVHVRRTQRVRVAATRCVSVDQIEAAVDASVLVTAFSCACEEELVAALSARDLSVSSYHLEVFIPLAAR